MNRLHLLIVAFALIACGGEPPRPSKTTIAVIPKGTTHEFWKSIHAGAVKARRELDLEIIWKGPLKEDNREDQIALVETFIARGVSGIVLAPLDDAALRVPVANAVRNGIPVVIIDSGLQSADFVSFVATDNYRGGRMAGAHMAQRLNQSGKVIMLRYQEGSASTAKRERGFLDAIGEVRGHRNRLVESARRRHHRKRVSRQRKPARALQRRIGQPRGARHLLPQRIHDLWHAARPARRGPGR